MVSGADLFMLYDTFGFPIDLAKDVADENGFAVDEAGFNRAMAEQREKSQTARAEAEGKDEAIELGQILADIPISTFLGYETTAAAAKVTAIVIDQEPRNKAVAGESGWITLDQTPFYGESGGQIGDIGVLTNETASLQITDTQKLHNGLMVHKFTVTQGELHVDDSVNAAIDAHRRQCTARNHSATHLLHRALRMTLGEHVHQAGSYVSDERLRFDFNNFEPLTKEQLDGIEQEVNSQIMNNLPITTQQLPLEEAKATGAMAFFGDKYGDIVRLVSMGDFSKELCGGTHCRHTGDIGLIKILGESGIGSGLRRIEACTGESALRYYHEKEAELNALAALLKANSGNIQKRLEQLLKENKDLSKELEKMRAAQDKDHIDGLWDQTREIGGLPVLTAAVAADDVPALRNISDMLRDKLPDAVLVLAAALEDKAAFVVAVPPAGQDKGLHAGKLIKEIAAVCGGSGGGRPDMAQAGGKDTTQIPAALQKAETLIAAALNA